MTAQRPQRILLLDSHFHPVACRPAKVYIHRLFSERAMKHLLNWALSALAVWIVARLVPGFHVSGPLAALIAALVIGFVNATLGVFLKIVAFPLVLLTLGLFWLVINAAMIE